MLFAVAGCSSSSSSKASTSNPSSTVASNTVASGTVASGNTTAPTTGATPPPQGGNSANAFCNRLAAGVDHLAAFQAGLRSGNTTTAMEQIAAENKAILAAAPSDIHDALATVNSASEKAAKMLDRSLSSADRAALSQEVAAITTSAAWKTAVADYTKWVTANCGTLGTKILTAGGG